VSDEVVDDFLAHYGVKGMRWGHRKSEEVSPERQAKREERAQKFERKAQMLDTKISEIANASHLKDWDKAYQIQELEAHKRTALSDAEAKRQGKLSAKQKKVIKGAAIATAIVAAYLIQDNVQSGEFTRLIAKGKAHFGEEDFKFKKNPDLMNPHFTADDIHERVVKHVNPDYGKIGTKMNCRRATFSYEMRRRGYDVKATKTTNGNGQHVLGLHNAITPDEKFKSTHRLNVTKTAISEIINREKGKGAPILDLTENFAAGGKNKIENGSSPSGIFDALSKQPDGSRGELGVMWSMGGGHSMAYEVFNGKAIIFDAQSGKKLDTAEKFKEAMGSVDSAGFTRLDNVELNHDYLMRWMTNAK
jgi:hypothetical protein